MCISCPLCVPLSHVEVHVGQMFQTKVWSVVYMEMQAAFLTFLLLLIIITFIRVPPASSVAVRKGQAEKKARDGRTQQRGLLRLLATSAIHSWHFKGGNVSVLLSDFFFFIGCWECCDEMVRKGKDHIHPCMLVWREERYRLVLSCSAAHIDIYWNLTEYLSKDL